MLIKYIIKNMLEHKMKTLLLLISISLSAAIFYVTISSNESIVNIAKEKLNTAYGNTDIIISPKTNSNTPYIEKEINSSMIEKQISILNTTGSYNWKGNNEDVDINGIEYEKLNILTKTTILEKEDMEVFEGNKIIISKMTKNKYNFQLGSEISIKINNKIEKLKVCAITANEGLMYSESDKMKVLVPHAYAENKLNVKDKTSIIYGKFNTSNINNKEEGVQKLTDEYQKYKITQLTPEEFLNGLNSNISMPLSIILLVVLIMSSFIIYTSVNLIIIERLPVVGTFLSLGSTTGKVNSIFLLESFIMGVISGIFGNILGIIGSFYLLYINSDAKELGLPAALHINLMFVFYTFILAVILSIISSVIPVLKINKISIKNIIMGIEENKSKRKNRTSIIGAIMVLIVIFNRLLLNDKYESIISILNILLVFVLSIVMLDTLINIIVKPIAKLTKDMNTINFLALNNVSTSKPLRNNIRLISICISVMVIISTVSGSIIIGLDNLYSQFTSDVLIMDIYDVNKVNDYLNVDKDVSSYMALYNVYNVKAENKEGKISAVQGVDPEKYKAYNNYFTYKDKEKNLNSLKENERNILLSTSLLDKYGKQIGDYIKLAKEDKSTVEYKITGAFNAQMQNMGSVALISVGNTKKDFEMINPSRISIKLNSGVNTNSYLKKLNNSEIKTVTKTMETEETRKERDVNANKSFIGILQGTSIFCLVIGGFGILNNMLINFIQRKKELAVLSSLGMSNGDRYLMLFLEALHCGVISILVSIFSSVLIVINLEGVFRMMGTYMKVIFSTNDLIKFSLFALLIILVSSISTIIRAKNISVIQEIRFE